MTPVYTYFSVPVDTESALQGELNQLRLRHPERFRPEDWQQIRVDRQLRLIDEEAIDIIQSRATDTLTCWAVRYRLTPDSQRLAAAYIKLNALVGELALPGSHKHIERRIAKQRSRITEIKYDLVHRSPGHTWLLGGLLMEHSRG